MYSDDYYSEVDECDDGRRQLEEYEVYVREQNAKANALLAHSGAKALARPVTEDLVGQVRRHATVNGSTTLADMLRNTIAEDVIIWTLQGRDALLRQPISRDGFIAIRNVLDQACSAFEALLAAEQVQ